MRKIVFILLLLFAANVSATPLDSVRRARVKVYSLLNIDTTGADGLLTGVVDDYVDYGIVQVNHDLGEYKKVELIISTSGARFTAIDSIVRIVSCQLVTNDSIIGLHVIRSEQIVDSVLAAESNTEEEEEKYAGYVFKWSDSIGFVPTPVQTDTFQVLYIAVIPTDSIRIIQSNDRIGVVYWAAYLGALDMDLPEKAALFEKLYQNFIALRLGK